jgi:hypothetical protein
VSENGLDRETTSLKSILGFSWGSDSCDFHIATILGFPWGYDSYLL